MFYWRKAPISMRTGCTHMNIVLNIYITISPYIMLALYTHFKMFFTVCNIQPIFQISVYTLYYVNI